MMKMARKKKVHSVDGNSFEQDFFNLKFIQEYMDWKDNVQGISGESIGVKNIPTLWDFLIVHIIDDNVRSTSVNRKEGRIGEGGIEALTAIEEIIQEGVLTKLDIQNIKNLAADLKDLQNSTLDPKLIVFTEKTYDKAGNVKGERDLAGHYRTPEYVKRRNKAGKGDGIPAVTSGWYLGGGNPPSFALFGGNAKYASPRSLLEIMEDISDSAGREGRGFGIENLEIKNIKGSNQAERMAGIRSIEVFFDKAIKNKAYWKGGRLLVKKLLSAFNAEVFRVTPREETTVRRLSGLGTGEKSIAGSIREVKFEVGQVSAKPIIDMVNAALVRAGTNKAADGYRAWQNASRTGFDYRKTRREVYGEGTQSPDSKLISKKWTDYLKV